MFLELQHLIHPCLLRHDGPLCENSILKDICETNKTMAIHEIHNAGSGSLLANVKPRLFSLLAILALLAAGTTTTPVYATIFSEDFQSLSNGPLAGQNGWTGNSEIRLSTSSNLSTRSVDGHDWGGIGFFGTDHAVDLSGVASQVVLSFDAYATSAILPKANNSGVSFNGISDGVLWKNATSNGSPRWTFDARGITGNSNNTWEVLGGHDTAVSMQLVIDKLSLEVFGRYDFGGGQTGETPHFPVLLSKINAVTHISILEDYRFADMLPFVGVDIDNITVAAVPEANAAIAFITVGISVAAFLGFRKTTIFAKNCFHNMAILA